MESEPRRDLATPGFICAVLLADGRMMNGGCGLAWVVGTPFGLPTYVDWIGGVLRRSEPLAGSDAWTRSHGVISLRWDLLVPFRLLSGDV
jgi:hypothetical protein